MIAIHKLQRPGSVDSLLKNAIWVYDGKEANIYEKASFAKWLDNIESGTVVHATRVHSCDALLLKLEEMGCEIKYCPWHRTGIESGLEPDKIVEAYWSVPQKQFIPFHARPDLATLRTFVRWRRAIVEVRKAANQRNNAIAESLGGVKHLTGIYKTNYENVQAALKNDKKKDGVEKLITEQVVEVAKGIRECQVFKDIADIADGWIAASTVVSYTGGVERFHSVSSFWKYCGQDVVDGHAPSRKRGSPHTWNAKVREALYQMADSIIKNRNNVWRDVFDGYREKELSVHDQKCPNCKTKEGHCTRRAMRFITKQILKEYYVEMMLKGQKRVPELKAMVA